MATAFILCLLSFLLMLLSYVYAHCLKIWYLSSFLPLQSPPYTGLWTVGCVTLMMVFFCDNRFLIFLTVHIICISDINMIRSQLSLYFFVFLLGVEC